jgi:8-oxo-dGTP pyrophosphatase MutT (NUDIX family)
MGLVPDHFYRQSGVIPLRRRAGKAEVLLVTSRKGKRWVIPKGVIDEGCSPADSAAREAWEEAGIRGTLSKEETGRYRYEKWGGVCTVQVFLLAVEEEADRWPESGTRQREWFGVEEAASRIDEDDLRLLIRAAGGSNDDGEVK